MTNKAKDKLIEVAAGFIAALLLGIIAGSMTGCDKPPTAIFDNNKNSGTGTRKVTVASGPEVTEYEWFKPTDTEGDLRCGGVIHWRGSSEWEATAYDDYSRKHFFNSEAEAEKWLTTNWCKP